MAGTALVAAAALLAACSTATSDESGPGSQPLPSITADSVNIGFALVDTGALAKSLGFKQPDYGGVELQTKAINAVIDYINANGGMGGRKATATVKSWLGSGDSPEQGQERCNYFTQDARVTGVVMNSGYQNNEIPCFKAANTLMADQRLFAHDATQFEANAPYLWLPTYPEYSGFMKEQLVAMKDAGYFDGNTGVLMMPSDDEVSRRTADTVVKPYLTSIGVTKIQTSYVDSTNTGTLGATSTAALATGKGAGLNRVIVVGGARIQAVALSDQQAVGYDSKWGVSTYDNPIFFENNPDSIVSELREGMTGLGFAPAQDVNQDQAPAFPDPTNAYQQKCYDIITAAGAAPPENTRANWRTALLYCDGAMFFDAVLDQAAKGGTLTAQQFAEAAGKIGATYGSSLGFGSNWAPGVYAGTNQAKVLAWSPECSCMAYSGEVRTFGAGPAVEQPAGSTA